MTRKLRSLLGIPWALLAAALVVAGCSSEQERVEEHQTRAEEHLEEGRYREALVELRSALALDPQDAELSFRIARALALEGEIGGAIFYYQEARRLDPDRVDAILGEATLTLPFEAPRAAELVQEALEMNPSNPHAYMLEAKIELTRNDLERALQASQRAVELLPEDPEVHYTLGFVHLAQLEEQRQKGDSLEPRRLESALAAFERSAELHQEKDRWRPLVTRARVLALWPGREEEAEGAFRSAVRAAKANPNPAATIAAAQAVIAYARSAQDRELRRWALEEIVTADDSRIEAWVELAALSVDRDESGKEVFVRLLAQRPRDARAHVAYAEFLVRNGDAQEAVTQLERSIGDGADPPVILSALLELQYQLGRSQDASKTVDRLRAEHPDHPSSLLAAARRDIAEGRAEAAADVLREAVVARESFRAEELLALAEFQLGNLESARSAIDHAVELTPAFSPRVQALRARILIAEASWNEAERTLVGLARRAGQLNRRERLMLARCYYETGRHDAGRHLLRELLKPPNLFIPAVLEFAAHEQARHPEETRQFLEQAHRMAPSSPALLQRLTQLDVSRGEPTLALERLDQAIASGADQPLVLLSRARVLAGLGRMEEAERDALRAFEMAPALPSAAALLAGIYGARGEVAGAVATLERANAEGTLATPSRMLLARLYAETGDEAKALALYESVVASGENLPSARNDLAFLLAREGTDLDRALELAQQAYQALPQDPAVLDTLGYVFLRRNLPEIAASHFRKAIDLAEEQGTPSAAHYYHLGLALRLDRQNRSAAEAFDRCLALDPNFAEADDARRHREAALEGAPPPTDLF